MKSNNNGIEDFRTELKNLIEIINQDNLSTNKLKILKKILQKANPVDTFDTTKQKEIWDVFEEIDTNNATTAIGTIEFIDKISKLNSIESSCFELKSDFEKYINVYSIQDSRDSENARSTSVF
jgi:GDP-D-mannose dehydratase